MSAVEELRRRVEDAPTEYECGLCGARYGRNESNCPSCGGSGFDGA